jgi:hypothetical protein
MRLEEIRKIRDNVIITLYYNVIITICQITLF